MEDRQTQFAARLDSFSPIQWELIPDFGLYMDQVITFVERQCQNLFREGERVFTPAMVNNYVKFGLVNRPLDKKYGREQLAQLMMICVLKQSASADGMKALLTPPEGVSLQAVYDRSDLIHRAIETLRRTLIEESIIVALVCVVFLLHARSALVAIIMLPIGVMIAFIANSRAP